MKSSNSKILNLWLVNQLENQNKHLDFVQSQNVKGNLHRPRICSTVPNYILDRVLVTNEIPKDNDEPKKWANTSINYNLRKFLMLNDIPDSENPFNDHSAFENCQVLFEGWIEPRLPRPDKRSTNRQRKIYSENIGVFESIFMIAGFDKESPICLDRDGFILDGYSRMYAMRELWGKGEGQKVYVRQYDFE